MARGPSRAPGPAPSLGPTLHAEIALPYFLTYANDEQRERRLPGIASGELITAVAMTEPGMGSDLASMAIRGSFQNTKFKLAEMVTKSTSRSRSWTRACSRSTRVSCR